MHEPGGSFEPHLLSLPFALAPAAMLIVIAYTAVMRGAPILRAFLLAHAASLLPYATAMTLSPSITSEVVADRLFRIAACTIPLAAATGSGLQLALIRRFRRYRYLIWALLASAVIWIPIAITTSAVVDGVQRLSGFWFPVAGRWAWLGILHTMALTVVGFTGLTYVAFTSRPSLERRQLRGALLANFVTYAGLGDVSLAYGVGVFPIGWLLSGIGSLLVVRALVVEDLLRVRAVDTAAPLLVVHLAAGALLGWVALAQLPPPIPWWIATLTLAMCFLGVRNAVETVALITRGGRGGEGPLERLLAQLVGRARALTDETAICQLAIDIIELAIGVRPQLLLASAQDWGWTTQTGERLDESRAPDPLVMSWLAEQPAPRFAAALFADDLEPVPPDLHELVAPLFERHAASVLVPVRSADELLGMIVILASGRRMRGRALEFIERAAERLAEALAHARMARRAAERAELAREVELAATVQAELLPGKGPHVHGDIAVVGSWRPATRCAGDFWGVYPLGDNRVLVTIGDVTGHGVASAMVTAAAIGACDVCVRRGLQQLDLTELVTALDAAVRRVGGGELAMTCFAGIFDPDAREIRFVSCGHTAPYLCRPAAKGVELHALVGRGNLLGAGAPTAPRVLQRALSPGDVVVCYTDGVIEAQDPAGTPFGDRRLQHLLKKLDPQRLSPLAVHDVVQAGVAAHRAGRTLADDETVVVIRMSPRHTSSIEPARGVAS